jgi:hypothetical protein
MFFHHLNGFKFLVVLLEAVLIILKREIGTRHTSLAVNIQSLKLRINNLGSLYGLNLSFDFLQVSFFIHVNNK